jgi:hypothetical protein
VYLLLSLRLRCDPWAYLNPPFYRAFGGNDKETKANISISNGPNQTPLVSGSPPTR